MENRKDFPFDPEEMFSRESILAKVQPVLVNREKNEELLKTVPSRWFVGDLAIIYKMILEDFDGNASVTVKNDIIKHENLTEEDLYEAALKNLKENTVINSMFDIMKQMMLEDCMKKFPEMSDDQRDNMVNEMMMMTCPGEDELLTVITNKKKFYGAASILDEATLMELRDTFDSDFYILPSSIHELIVVPTKKADDVKQLKDMVREVNDTQVAPDEILSYNVYMYKDGKVSVA